MATKTTMDDQPAPKKGRGYIAYSTQSKDQGNVPGKKFNVIGVPGATIPPQAFSPQEAGTENTAAEGTDRQVTPDLKPGYTVLETEQPGRKTRYKLGVPGATVYPAGVPHLEDKPKPTLGGVPQRTSNVQNPDSETVEIPRRTHQTAGGDKAKPVVPAARSSQSTTPQDPQAPQLDSYDKMLEYMQANQIADADAAGRARRREMMAAIGDGISAVSSLYQTTKGAPVTYTPGADMSKVMRDRYDRMIAQRKADSDKYLNYLRVQQAKDQADELREYKRANQEIRREELQRQKDNDKAREDYRKMNLRQRELERDRKIANSPGGDVYFETVKQMLADGYSEDEAYNEGMKELAAYNAAHGTNYTVVDRRDNSGRVSRTVTVKTKDAQTAAQAEQTSNSNVANAPAPVRNSRKGKGGSTSKKSSTKKPKAY